MHSERLHFCCRSCDWDAPRFVPARGLCCAVLCIGVLRCAPRLPSSFAALLLFRLRMSMFVWSVLMTWPAGGSVSCTQTYLGAGTCDPALAHPQHRLRHPRAHRDDHRLARHGEAPAERKVLEHTRSDSLSRGERRCENGDVMRSQPQGDICSRAGFVLVVVCGYGRDPPGRIPAIISFVARGKSPGMVYD